MWQEYCSYPSEAFAVSTDGNYYAKDMMALRKRGGITQVPGARCACQYVLGYW